VLEFTIIVRRRREKVVERKIRKERKTRRERKIRKLLIMFVRKYVERSVKMYLRRRIIILLQ